MVLEESVDKVYQLTDAFPKNVAHAKALAAQDPQDSDRKPTNVTYVLQTNANRLDTALTTFDGLISKIRQAIDDTVDAIDLISRPTNLSKLHRLGAVFAERGITDPVDILLNH
jgi:hypothetical protein